MHRTVRAIAILAAAAGLTAADGPPLTGMWGAADALLALDAEGGRLQVGCQLARLTPVRPNASGEFTAEAQVESLKVMLPEDDEAEPAAVPAKVSGRIGGGRIDLVLTVQGQAPRTLQLLSSQIVKPARCL